SLTEEAELEAAGRRLREQTKVEAVLITRGALGMNLFDGDGHHTIPTRPRQVADVCGAGDTVISTYALAAVAGASAILSAELANFAAGKVVEEMGVVPITSQQLEEFHQDPEGSQG
ncbi:MAG: PfkB family carbohydrate kinase, partial [Candidatus Neomarinimicrobiota bacterium]